MRPALTRFRLALVLAAAGAVWLGLVAEAAQQDVPADCPGRAIAAECPADVPVQVPSGFPWIHSGCRQTGSLTGGVVS